MKQQILNIVLILTFSSSAVADYAAFTLDQQPASPTLARELLDYFRSRAIEGDAHAQFRIGFAYETGDGLNEDREKARSWYKRAALQGHKNAIMNLAAMEERNRVIIEKPGEDESRLNQLALEGDIEARNQLARMLVNNALVQPDRERLFHWMQQQSQAGDQESQLIMGQMYEMGIAVPQNHTLSYAWYSVAAAAGNEVAMFSRDAIASRMSQSQLEKGQEASTRIFEEYVQEQRPSQPTDEEFIEHPQVGVLFGLN